jgi:hypothetical protein
MQFLQKLTQNFYKNWPKISTKTDPKFLQKLTQNFYKNWPKGATEYMCFLFL